MKRKRNARTHDPIYEGLRSQCMPRQSETPTVQVLRGTSSAIWQLLKVCSCKLVLLLVFSLILSLS